MQGSGCISVTSEAPIMMDWELQKPHQSSFTIVTHCESIAELSIQLQGTGVVPVHGKPNTSSPVPASFLVKKHHHGASQTLPSSLRMDRYAEARNLKTVIPPAQHAVPQHPIVACQH